MLGRKIAALAVLASLLVVSCTGYAVSYDDDEDIPEADFPGMVLPDMGEDESLQADPKPCCLPKQWQGNVTSQAGWTPRRRRGAELGEEPEEGLGGRRQFRQQTVTVYVDQDAKKVAGRVKCCKDTCGFVVVFGSNNTADTYLFKMAAKKCKHIKSNRAIFRKQCIPDNATFEGTVKLGPSSGPGVQIWRFRGRPHHRDNNRLGGILVSGRIVVAPDQCIPVIVQDHGIFRLRPRPHEEVAMDDDDDGFDLDTEDDNRPGPHPRSPGFGVGFMGSAFFSNIEASVKDPKVFTPPDFCKGVEGGEGSLKLGEDMEYPDVIDRLVTLN